MDPDDARARFAGARVARLGTVGPAGEPHLVPVTFACRMDTVYTAVDAKPKTTRRLKRLANLESNPAVCLLVDHYSDDWDDLWWVRADGRAHVVPDGPEFGEAIRSLRAKYPQYADAPPEGPAIVVAVTRWQGWSAA
ncbi:MAG: TIGR03668 family PPOX class F420-dependent oxidoreductase [Propionibacteriales bacterium]|nr:TIGR03668 family PPOX class F420-dependent oxidoreductase [Propionibacteriales bacterium]